MRVAGIISLTVLTTVSLTALVSAREPTKQEFLAEVEKKLRATTEQAGPAVACVVVSKSDRYPKAASGDPPGKLGGYDPKKSNPGSGGERSLDLSDPKNIPDHGCACGVVIDPAGLVLTPYHVVDGATKIYVHLPGRAGSYADIHAADARYDLAVLKLITPPAGVTAIKFANVRLAAHNEQPATVYKDKLIVLLSIPPATGFAFGEPSADLACVRGVRPAPDFEPKGERPSDSYYLFGPLLMFGSLLAHEPAPGPVTDGSPLLNLDGELVGLTTSTAALTSERGPHYAFPADEHFRRVVGVLRRGEEVEYGYLGVAGPHSALGPDRKPYGVQFESVVPHGPAALAGLDERDIVTRVAGQPTTTYPELLLHVGSALAGEKVKLTALRTAQGRPVEVTVTVTLGKFKNDQPFIASVRPDPVFGLRVEYGSILSQKQPPNEFRARLAVPAGVCVRELVADSPAATAFKKLGDRPERWLITHLNGAPVATPAEFYKATKGQQTIRLTVKDPVEPNSRDREVTFP
ncbi:trypsin-like peptidase domain-containing protein [Frigoriglobus tundricola]|uniref:PDZ domain-containing protein n=1 Tax=Frigoriglobus tundricola TaxID=2774151 RepID=A0A6M5YGW7_9BACT|nr:trypsin-like peptidase domain-containing protein [Frigoriglobus tundricola]QJW92601.1 hypothetical protein FTUN_0098 [Frigoriglobus tundricola]